MDIDPLVLLEITGTQALRGLMQAGHLYWILMVAPKIASVAFGLAPLSFEDC